MGGRCVVVRGDDVHGDHRVRPLQLSGGLKARPVDLERGKERVGCEVRGERVREPEGRCQLRAVEARAEDPERDMRSHPRDRMHPLAGLRVTEQRLQLEDVLRERVRGRILAERPQRDLVGPRRAPHTEIDPPREERLQRPELLGDHEGRMIRQHHPAGPDADPLRPLADVGDDHRGGSARDPAQVVVLGDPVAVVAELLRMLREVESSCGAPARAFRPRRSVRGRGPRRAARFDHTPGIVATHGQSEYGCARAARDCRCGADVASPHRSRRGDRRSRPGAGLVDPTARAARSPRGSTPRLRRRCSASWRRFSACCSPSSS